MSFVRTLLEDIPADELGACLAHEHIIIDPSFATHVSPDFRLDDVERAIAELREVHRAGGRAMIDSMPCDAGRNVLKLAAISRGSGIRIVAPTGLHLTKYYDPGHWGNFYTADQLAQLFIADIETGIDAHDYNGPLVTRTPHRAGIIKIATDVAFTMREERLFAAAAEAHRRTGAPILTHTEQGGLALEQVERLRQLGVDLAHVCLSHLDRNPDPGYHREVLSSGVRLEYDSAFRWPEGEDNPTLRLVTTLIGEFPGQIMLGMDAARRSYWRSHGGAPGLDYLLTDFSARLRIAGLDDSHLRDIFVSTPAATFAFAPIITP